MVEGNRIKQEEARKENERPDKHFKESCCIVECKLYPKILKNHYATELDSETDNCRSNMDSLTPPAELNILEEKKEFLAQILEHLKLHIHPKWSHFKVRVEIGEIFQI